MMQFYFVLGVSFFLSLSINSVADTCQSGTLATQEIILDIDSGFVFGDQTKSNISKAAYQQEIKILGAASLRLFFDDVALSEDGESFLKVRSLKDGKVQTHNAQTLRQWNNTSAYFNGDSVVVELYSRSQIVRAVISKAVAQIVSPNTKGGGVGGGCSDRRELSQDPRVARLIQPDAIRGYCTAWLANDGTPVALNNKGLFTAGHCAPDGGMVVEFNVPLSNDDGTVNHPSPEDQYAVDVDSIWNGYRGIDAAYFGCHPNTETGKTPFEAQGAFYQVADAVQTVAGQSIRVTGYGASEGVMPPSWNAVQKTQADEYIRRDSNGMVRYRTYATGGNSGSPVFDEDAQRAIGIHTQSSPCLNYYGRGPAIDLPEIQQAYRNPLGVLIPKRATCYADCNADGVLDVTDLICFKARWQAADPWANCDGNITDDNNLMFDVNDFACFRQKYSAGCPES